MIKVFRSAPRGIQALSIANYLMSLGYYALIPYLALYLTKSLAWSMTLMGLLFATRQISQQGMMFLGGAIADKIGRKRSIVAGTMLRAAGFLAFGVCTQVPEFFLAAVVSGLGGALFSPASQAAFEAMTPDENREELIAFREVVDNVAFASSTLVGTLLSSLDFKYLSFFSGGIFIAVSVLVYFFVPLEKSASRRPAVLKNLKTVAVDFPFVLYTSILVGYHYLDAQLYYTVPQRLLQLPGGSVNITLMYVTIASAIIFCQLHLTRIFEHYPNRIRLLAFGTLIMGTMLHLLAYIESQWLIVPLAFFFAVGMMLSSPVVFELVAFFGKRELMGAYYGFNAYSIALGGALGSTLGGWSVDYAKRTGTVDLPWWICLWVGVSVAVGLLLFERVFLTSRRAAGVACVAL